MSVINYFGFAYCGILVYFIIRRGRLGFSLSDFEFLVPILPIALVLFVSNEFHLCAIRCLVFSVPIIFCLFNDIYSNKCGTLHNIFPVLILWSGLAVIETIFCFINVSIVYKGVMLFTYYLLVFICYLLHLLYNARQPKYEDIICNAVYLYKVFLVKISLDIIGFLVLCSLFNLLPQNFVCWIVLIVFFVVHVVFVFSCFLSISKRFYPKEKVKKYYEVSDEGAMNVLKDCGWSDIDESAKEDAKIVYALLKLFETHKPYRQYDIKVKDIASLIGTNKTYLSRALNRRLSKNFSQFVNAYRIKDVCEAFIKNPSIDIKDIADNYGFNSQSNFSIVFKCHVGYTPSDWCREIKKRIANNEQVNVNDYVE